MTIWQVWSEGYLTSGMEGIPATATYHGTWPGETFADACETWADGLTEGNRFTTINGKQFPYFNKDHLMYWGSRLFDNEADARKRFG